MSTDHLAVLLRAVAALRPAGPLDPALLQALARLIAPRPAAGAPVVAADARAPAPAPVAPSIAAATAVVAAAGIVLGSLSAKATGVADRPGAAAPRPAVPAADTLAALAAVLEQVTERADLAAAQQAPAALGDAAPGTPEAPGPSAPVESLFAPRRVRAILRELTTQALPNGQVDIAAAVALIARAEPIDRLPQRLVSSLGHSVQLLFDSGPALLPFTQDRQQLAATAIRLLGEDRVRTADFLGDPARGVRAQGQVRWAPLHWPARHSTLVVVSDLGLGDGRAAVQAAGWRRFLDEAKQRGLRSVLLIPYAPVRWPAVARRFDTTLTWDLASGVQGLRRSARRGGAL